MAGTPASGPGGAKSSWALASPQRKLCPETAEATGKEGKGPGGLAGRGSRRSTSRSRHRVAAACRGRRALPPLRPLPFGSRGARWARAPFGVARLSRGLLEAGSGCAATAPRAAEEEGAAWRALSRPCRGLRRSGGLGASLRAGPPEVSGGAAERQVRGGGGCGSAVLPHRPPALCASPGELAPRSAAPPPRESRLAVGIGKSGAEGQQKAPPGFPACGAACSPPRLTRLPAPSPGICSGDHSMSAFCS